MGGSAVAGAVVANRVGVGTAMALVVLVLAFAPAERIREQLSFAGHQLPATAVFLFGAAIAIAVLTGLILR